MDEQTLQQLAHMRAQQQAMQAMSANPNTGFGLAGGLGAALGDQRSPRLIAVQVNVMENGFVITPTFDTIGSIHGVRPHIARDEDECTQIIGRMLRHRDGLRVAAENK